MTVPEGGTLDVPLVVTCQPAQLLVYAGNCGGLTRDICTVRTNGADVRRLTAFPGDEADPEWSPDGSRIVFVAQEGTNRDIYVMNADGTAPLRLTTHAAADHDPTWSPDGTKIAFASERDGNADIYVMNADGSNVTRITTNPFVDEQPAWSPDGSRIAYRSEQLAFGAANGEIMSMRADGTDVQRLTVDGADDTGPAWSPDGSRIAFARFMNCFASGDDTTLCQSDIFTMPAAGGAPTRVGGVRRPFGWPGFAYDDDEKRPAWSPDGRKIVVELSSCASDGHCHEWTGLTSFTLGVAGFADIVYPGYAPSWRRQP